MLTLNDLQSSLMESERLEYMNSCRNWIAAQCGLAGMLILENSFAEACRVYDGVIGYGLADEDGKVDSQQMLHAAFNLLQALEMARNARVRLGAPAIDEQRARKLLESLETKFLREARDDAQSSFAALDGVRRQIEALRPVPWWTETLRAMPEESVRELLHRLQENAFRSSVLAERLAGCSSAEGLNALVEGLLGDLSAARHKVLQVLDERLRPKAQRDPTQQEVAEQRACGHCHRHRAQDGEAEEEAAAVMRETCSLCRFERESILPYERVVYLFDETTCRGCSEPVVQSQSLAGVHIDGDEEVVKLAMSEDLLKIKPLEDIRKLCRDRGLKLTGTKKTLVKRLLEDLKEPAVKTNASFCQFCHRWWHKRCLPKDVQKLLNEQGGETDWRCPACLGQAQEGHSAGLVRHPGIAQQLLLAIRPYHASLFGSGKAGSGEDEEDEEGEEEEAEGELANAKELEVRRHLKQYFGLVEAELEHCRKVFTALHTMVGVHDTLAQCKMRVRLARDGEEISEQNERVVIPRMLLPDRKMLLELELEEYDAQRRAALSKYRFLKNNGEQSSNCPICLEEMDGVKDIALLPCSHKSHWECAQEWWDREVKKKREEKHGHAHPTCSVCRAAAPRSEVKRIQNNQIEVKERVALEDQQQQQQRQQALLLLAPPAAVQVAGSWGTKITAVVADLKQCQAKQEQTPARIVLFSQFPEMLPVVQEACAANGLAPFVLFGKSGAATQRSIELFKSRAKVERFVVLLLPISRGAEGLTLIEGNTVMLLEPAFPMALEQQAIARMHRIGQMHPATYVYRYLIKGTVEQRIAEIGAAEESLEVDMEAPAQMNDAVVEQLLLPPKPHFDVHSLERREEEAEGEEGFDADELWWLTKVEHGRQIKTRRDLLERFLKMEADVATEVLHGVEVPVEAVKLLNGLKEV